MWKSRPDLKTRRPRAKDLWEVLRNTKPGRMKDRRDRRSKDTLRRELSEES